VESSLTCAPWAIWSGSIRIGEDLADNQRVAGPQGRPRTMTTPALVSMQGRLADSGSEGFREASTPRTTTVGATTVRTDEPTPVPGSTAIWEGEWTFTSFEGGKGTKTVTAVPPSAVPLLLPEVSPTMVKPMTTATTNKALNT
jgi:hypothetical protein